MQSLRVQSPYVGPDVDRTGPWSSIPTCGTGRRWHGALGPDPGTWGMIQPADTGSIPLIWLEGQNDEYQWSKISHLLDCILVELFRCLKLSRYLNALPF